MLTKSNVSVGKHSLSARRGLYIIINVSNLSAVLSSTAVQNRVIQLLKIVVRPCQTKTRSIM